MKGLIQETFPQKEIFTNKMILDACPNWLEIFRLGQSSSYGKSTRPPLLWLLLAHNELPQIINEALYFQSNAHDALPMHKSLSNLSFIEIPGALFAKWFREVSKKHWVVSKA